MNYSKIIEKYLELPVKYGLGPGTPNKKATSLVKLNYANLFDGVEIKNQIIVGAGQRLIWSQQPEWNQQFRHGAIVDGERGG